MIHNPNHNNPLNTSLVLKSWSVCSNPDINIYTHMSDQKKLQGQQNKN